MPFYSCKNCCNLKRKLITKTSIRHISKYKIKTALKKHDVDSLGLMFPFNLTVYKRIMKYGECKIFYCSEHIFGRDLYIFRESINLDDVISDKQTPCPKYK